MPDVPETRHDRFLRLMQRRLGRALEEMRLVSQLSGKNYENTPEEADEVIQHLDRAVHTIAAAFEVPYKTAIGAASRASLRSGPIDETEVARAIDAINAGEGTRAITILTTALNQAPRP